MMKILSRTCLLLAWPLVASAQTLPVNSGGGASDLPSMSRQECTDVHNGIIVGDIGNGAIFRDDYRCESNGEPPIGAIVPQEGEPIPIEGEVCCGPPTNEGGLSVDPTQSAPIDLPAGDTGTELPTVDPPSVAFLEIELSPLECEEQGGEIVGDIGDGATAVDGYLCESNGEPPIGTVIREEGEPIAIEGEVCCGSSAPSDPDKESSLSSSAIAGLVVGSGAAFLLVAALLIYSSNQSKPHAVTASTKDVASTSTEDAADQQDKV